MINEEGSEERMLGVRVGSAVYLSFVLVFFFFFGYDTMHYSIK